MGDTVLRLCLLSALLAGCGNVAGTKPVDAGVDADLGGDATVVTQAALFGTTGAVGNIDVISMLPNNTVLATAKTDASGNATIRVYPGGTVTAVYKHTVNMGADLITWAGVKPGDKLTFSNRNPGTSGQPTTAIGAQTYSWPTLAAASFYQVFTACNSGSVSAPTLSIAMSEFPTCHQDPTMTVLYAAFDANSVLINFGIRSTAFVNAQTVALGSWATAATGTINITGLPPEVALLNGGFRSVIDPRFDLPVFGSYSGTPTGGAFTTTFKISQAGTRTVGSLNLGRTGFRSMQILDSFSTSTTTQTVAAPVFPPWGQTSTIMSTALGMASWFVVPSPSSSYQGQFLRVTWTHSISGVFHPSQWDFILPPGVTSLTFPALPAPLDGVLPAPQDTGSASTRVFDIPSITSYDMLRALPSGNIMCLECSVRAGDFQRVVFTQL